MWKLSEQSSSTTLFAIPERSIVAAAYVLELADRETVKRKRRRFVTAFFAVMAAALILIIRVWNGAHAFWPAYGQSLLFL